MAHYPRYGGELPNDGGKARLRVFDPEGIGDAPDGAIGGDQHDIKAHPRRAMAGMGGKPGVSRRDQPGALARAKGEGGLCQRWPGLYFNEGKKAFAFGDQVNFTGFGAASLGQNGPAFGGQGGGGESFGILPGSLGAPTTQQAMGGWGLAGHYMNLQGTYRRPARMAGETKSMQIRSYCYVMWFPES